MEITIGRENSRLQRLQIGKGDVVRYYGEVGSVPKSVSRSHCKLMSDGTKVMVESVSDNIVYVNGREVETKVLKKGDAVHLGEDRYILAWETVLETIANETEGYSLEHLKDVWERYDSEKLRMQIATGRFNAISSVTGLMGSLGIICCFIPSLPDFSRVICAVIGLVLGGAFAAVRYSNSSKLPLKQRELENWFHRNYVCPNPKCQRFLGVQPYDDLVKNVGCPNCRSKYRQ